MAHELCHVLQGLHTETISTIRVHDHLDYVVYSDQDEHVDETDLTCVLCSVSMTGVLTLAKVPVHQATSVYHLGGLAFQVDRYLSHFSIRGPPMHTTIS